VYFENIFVNIKKGSIEITHVRKGITVKRNYETHEKPYKEP
jgi:hypothetical protein